MIVNQKYLYIIFILSVFSEYSLCTSSYPYVAGNTFKYFADHVFDENTTFKPENVKNNNIIFVKTDYLNIFFNNYHPSIKAHYILITHNSDYSVPGSFAHYLDEDKLIAWFGQNVDGYQHPKLIPIPIGIANSHWPHGNTKSIKQAQKITQPFQFKHIKNLLYMNFAVSTNYSQRDSVSKFFTQKEFCYKATRKPFEEYLTEMGQFIFVVSPPGNGLDCHRTWEALLLGCIPIVKSSSLNYLYHDLPVIIINDWQEVTYEFLIKSYETVKIGIYNLDKLYADYWLKAIKSHVKAL